METNEAVAPLDIDATLARVRNNKKLVRKCIEFMLSDYPNRVTALLDAYKAQDAENLWKEAHRLKGAAAGIDALPLKDLAKTLEMQGRESNLSEAESLIAQIGAECERIQHYYQSVSLLADE